MYLIGLTGGIASGKSTIARRLVEHGAQLVDADRLAREVVEPGSAGLKAIVERFGPSVIDDAGRLDRTVLGGIVFADEESRLALNAIVHPEVWRAAEHRFAEIEDRDPGAVVVYDVPLLVEAGKGRPLRFDRIVVVHAPAAARIQRLVELRGSSEADAAARVSAQATDEERLAVADTVIDASGTLDETLRQADELWAEVSAIADSDAG